MNELLHVGWCGTNPWRCQSAQLQLVEAVHKSFYSGTIVAIDAGGETIEATVGHPFWVVSGESLALRPAAHELGTPISRGGRWVESDDLRIGDKLLARDGSQIAVTAIRTRTTQEWVYNLTVRRTHTYTVGSAGVVVHNQCTLDDIDDGIGTNGLKKFGDPKADKWKPAGEKPGHGAVAHEDSTAKKGMEYWTNGRGRTVEVHYFFDGNGRKWNMKFKYKDEDPSQWIDD